MPTVPAFLYGTAWKEDRTAALTEAAIRAGFQAIDTANQRRHYNEAGVGEALSVTYRDGIISRADIFLQTKFTYQRGQDHRLPYDPTAPLSVQVAQSLASSLEHLDTDYVDSFLLHGPSSSYEWGDEDAEVWEAMLRERDAGRASVVGVSNISLQHLQQMAAAGGDLPTFVQNRCYARTGWDRDVRRYCSDHNIRYQGFSLLTANVEALRHPLITNFATNLSASPAQIIFAFARAVGMLPLTGTSNEEHMKDDLASMDLVLADDAVQKIERAFER